MTEKYQFKTEPYEHQKTAWRRAWGKTGFAYLMDTRTGKSKTFVDECCMLYERGQIDGVLLFAPKGVYLNWTKVNEDDPDEDGEWHRHMPDRHWKNARVVEWRAGGGPKYHQARLRQLLEPHDGLKILVMNSEALSHGDKGYRFAKLFLTHCNDAMLGVDESVDFSQADSERTRRMLGKKRRGKPPIVSLRDLAKYRRILNGLLCPRDCMQSWSQFEILGEGMLGQKDFWTFKHRYGVVEKKEYRVRDKKRKVEIVVAYRHQDELQERIAEHSFRIRRDECWDLPPTVYAPRDVELTDEQMRVYSEILAFAYAELDEQEHVTATAVITQLLRLHQVVCGFVKDDKGQEHDLESNRVDELLRVTENTNDKIIVWCAYRRSIDHVGEALRKMYGDSCLVEYHGGVRGADRMPNVTRFQTDDSCRFFLATDAAAKGLKLTAAGTMIYFSNWYSLDKRSQSEDRPLGKDQVGAVHCVDLVARGTVDEKIVRSLRKKINMSSAIMGDDYKEWLI